MASKTFTTIETITNATSGPVLAAEGVSTATTRRWPGTSWALSTNAEKVTEFGIDPDNMFAFLGLGSRRPVLVRLRDRPVPDDRHRPGPLPGDARRLPAGRRPLPHTRPPRPTRPPCCLGLLGIWYDNFLDAQTHAVLPYSHYLSKFTAYLQQLDMESNGKSVQRDGNPVEWQTGPVVWGTPAPTASTPTTSLIHQGTKLIPADFIGFARPVAELSGELKAQHDLLMANFFAQTQALAFARRRRRSERRACPRSRWRTAPSTATTPRPRSSPRS
ncbi:hypothetical protein GCM10017687_45970 [Streptomyces echinatus]